MVAHTRSKTSFDSDAVVDIRPLRRGAVRVLAKHGVVTDLTFARAKCVDECEVFITLPLLTRDVASLKKTCAANKLVRVRAWDTDTKRGFDRGFFHISNVGAKKVLLTKIFPAASREKEAAPEWKPEPATVPLPVMIGPLSTTRVFARPVVDARPVVATLDAAKKPWIKAIPTVYSGVQYRSRLEVKFAHLLTCMNIRFLYEPVRHKKTQGGTYTIDFFLPDQQLYVELKPKRPHVEEEQRCEDMSALGFRVALLYGSAVHQPPFRSELYMGKQHRDYKHHDALRGMCWIDGKKLGGETVFVVGNCGETLDVRDDSQPHLGQVASTYDKRWSHPTLLHAYKQLLGDLKTLFT